MKANLTTFACIAALCLLAGCATDRDDAAVDNTTGNTYQPTPGPSGTANQGSSLDTVNSHGHTTSQGTTSAPHQKRMSGEDQSVGSTGSATGAE